MNIDYSKFVFKCDNEDCERMKNIYVVYLVIYLKNVKRKDIHVYI